MLLDLLRIILRNIKDDVRNNLLGKLPILLILDPDTFDPPFIDGFEEYTNATRANIGSSAILAVLILLAAFDIVYSVIRLALAGLIMGVVMGVCGFFLIWFYVTFARRWKLVIKLFRGTNSNGVW